ncbi:MAG: hypothetical protein Q8L78_09380 [Coxiellaceae bacterium]|nr:hypothetical protein [Coxiellaceae bacterium]
MPDLKELVEQRERKQFKKRSYRPWDLTGNGNLSENMDASNLITPPCNDTAVIEIGNQEQAIQTDAPPPLFSDKKVNTNSTQTTHKVNTNSTHKLNTNQTQSEHKKIELNTNSTQTTHKVHTKLNTQKTQTTHKLNTNSTQIAHISTIIGVQRMILLFVFEECKKARSYITEPLSIFHIAANLEIASGSVKTSISRLCEKNFLKINRFKNGRGGWSVYEIPDSTYKELLQMETQHKLHTNYTQSEHKLHTKLNTQPNTSSLSSSSILNTNKTTITATDEKDFLPEEWLKIDTSPLEHIYFSKTQLRQLVDKNIPDVVQESINYFSHEILQEPEKYTKPLNVLMGVLRQGNAWAAPKGYEAPKDKAQREYFERKKAENEKRNQFVSELMDLEFLDWQSRLSDQDLELIVPEDVRASRLTAAKTSVLKNYFKDQVLIPRLKNEGLY